MQRPGVRCLVDQLLKSGTADRRQSGRGARLVRQARLRSLRRDCLARGSRDRVLAEDLRRHFILDLQTKWNRSAVSGAAGSPRIARLRLWSARRGRFEIPVCRLHSAFCITRADFPQAARQRSRAPCRTRSRRMRRVRACRHSPFAESPLLAADATRPLRTRARSLPARAPTES